MGHKVWMAAKAFTAALRARGTAAAVTTPAPATVEPLEVRALFSAGALDPTFGHAGIVLGSGGGGDAVAVLAGGGQAGKVLSAGTAGGRVRVARYTAAGGVDRTFGGGAGAVS